MTSLHRNSTSNASPLSDCGGISAVFTGPDYYPTDTPAVSSSLSRDIDMAKTAQEKEDPNTSDSSSEKQNSFLKAYFSRLHCASHTRKILILIGIILIPMTAFTIIFLWLIFGHTIGEHQCPYPELCLTSEQLNLTGVSSYYIVDFPAARLVFIASWSSSLSFTLLGPLMAVYTYIAAHRWLTVSSQPNPALPTPYQAGMMLRILNAEALALYEIISRKLKEVFWEKKKTPRRRQSSTTPKTFQYSVAVLIMGVIGAYVHSNKPLSVWAGLTVVSASLLIQAADTYVHITTRAVNWVHVYPALESYGACSHIIAPEFFERPTHGSPRNRNYWGLSVEVEMPNEVPAIVILEYSTGTRLGQDASSNSRILDYSNESVPHVAILAARVDDPNVDWSASSFGVSTQCRAVNPDDCDLSENYDLSLATTAKFTTGFNCSAARSGVTASGQLYAASPQYSFLDFHSLVHEPNIFFLGTAGDYFNDPKIAMQALEDATNLSDEDGANVFSNPWSWLAFTRTSLSINDTRLWNAPLAPGGLMLHCNSTVYDVDYSVVNEKVAHIARRKSNSSTTGTSSFRLSPLFSSSTDWFVDMEKRAFSETDSVEEVIRAYEQAASRKFVQPLYPFTDLRSAHSVQRRETLLVSAVPKAAVLALILADLLFMVLAIVLALFALHVAAPDVHQVQARIGVMGLSAQNFEYLTSKRKAKSDIDLFEEREGEGNGIVKRVAVERTAEGGATYSLSERWEDQH